MTAHLHYKQLFGYSEAGELGVPAGEMLAYARASSGVALTGTPDVVPSSCFAGAPHLHDSDELLVAIQGNPRWTGLEPSASSSTPIVAGNGRAADVASCVAE